MDSFEGYLMAVVVAYFLIKNSMKYPNEMVCLPPIPKKHPAMIPLCDCPLDNICAKHREKPECSVEHFAPYNQAEFHQPHHTHDTTSTIGDPKGDGKCNSTALVIPPKYTGYMTPYYTGYFPYSYGYGGRPYGAYRPTWGTKDCGFCDRY